MNNLRKVVEKGYCGCCHKDTNWYEMGPLVGMIGKYGIRDWYRGKCKIL